MNRCTRAAGIVAWALPGFALAASADLRVNALNPPSTFGPVNPYIAFSFGVDTCNVGDQSAAWGTTAGTYPLHTENLYRLENGRFEQIGMMWVYHNRLCALNQPGCGDCGGGLGCQPFLSSGCENTNSAQAIGSIPNLGLRGEVDPFTGDAPFPFTGFGQSGSGVDRRIRVAMDDLEPVLHPTARFFAEGIVISPDEIAGDQRANNVTYEEYRVSGTGASLRLIPIANSTVVGRPAIEAWSIIDPERVWPGSHGLPDDGLYHIASRVRRVDFTHWEYEYAIYNQNATNAASQVRVLTGSAQITSPRFEDADYHSGDPTSGDDWMFYLGDVTIAWAADMSPGLGTANTLRWGTLYNFGFIAEQPPVGIGRVVLHFPDGQALDLPAYTPDIDGYIVGDVVCDGVVNVSDIAPFVTLLTDPQAYVDTYIYCNPLAADCSGDGQITVADISCFVDLITNG